MLEKKKRLYQDKEYFLLFLSITSDISVSTAILSLIYVLIWCEIDPSVGYGVGFYWVIGIALNLFIGIPCKVMDIANIKYIEGENKLKKHNLLFMHCLFSAITIFYWSWGLFMFT